MKKIAVAVLAVLLFAPSAFAVGESGWGLGVKLGFAENDPKDMKNAYDAYGGSKEITKNPAYLSVEGQYEWNFQGNDADKLGFRFGFDFYGENKLEFKNVPSGDVTETTYAFPLTFYYRRDNGVKGWSFFGGAGVTFLTTEMEYKGIFRDYRGKSKDDKTKVFPHITAGVEYRFTELFALGLDARYNFGAKVKKNGWTISDRSGFGAAIAGRFYF